MTTIPKSQAKKAIQDLLPVENAFSFFIGRQYLMAVAIDQESPITTQRLNTLFNDDRELIDKMVNVYSELASTFFHQTERVNSRKTVSGEKSLLGYLTDGESHLKIYPTVDFTY